MNTMKKYIPILLMLVLLASCGKEFLNKQPHEFTDAVFWKTAAQAEAALAGVYTPLQDEEALGGESGAAWNPSVIMLTRMIIILTLLRCPSSVQTRTSKGILA